MTPTVPSRALLKAIFLFLFLVLTKVSASFEGFEQDMAWKVGLAKVAITPEQRLPMAGYASRKAPSEGTEQELFAKAMAIQDGNGETLVMVTLDLIGVHQRLRTDILRRLKESHGLKEHQLLMNASHTHCGPDYVSSDAAEYYAQLTEKICSVIGQSLAKRAPAQIDYCVARCGFAMNRRTHLQEGFINHPAPEGPVDHSVPVLRIADHENRLVGILFGYACHNTTMGFQKWLGDYAGYAQEYLEADHPGVSAHFMMGCGGDQNPYPRRELKYAQAHGRSLATAVESALELDQSKPHHRHSLRGPLRMALGHVALDKTTKEVPSVDYPIHAIRFGDQLQLIALGSEATIDYALRLKRELTRASGPHVWIAGYSNFYDGYIPSRRVLVEGGYEASSRPWNPSIESRIVDKCHELVCQLQMEKIFVAAPATDESAFTEGIEGPACDHEGNVYAVNHSKQQTIGILTPGQGPKTLLTLPGQSVGNGIRCDARGNLYIADYVEHKIWKWKLAQKELQWIVHEPRMNQPNDLALSNDGSLFASDPNWKLGTGQVWRIDPDGSVELVASDMGTTNGIDLSPDEKKLYVNESNQRKIWVFDVSVDKKLSHKRLLCEFPDHGFDGMRTDVDGNLYVTRYGKGTVAKLSPQGDLIREIDVLGSKPSNICFGGADGRTAYVTEVERKRIVSFRVDRPGREWVQLHGAAP